MARYANKRDANEREIIEALQCAGCFVLQEQNVDLWVLPPNNKQWIPIEVKTKTGRLTSYQIKLHNTLNDIYNYRIAVVTTIEEAFDAVGIKYE
jgi:hypothetical protein